MNVVITGTKGYIAASLKACLEEAGHIVTLIGVRKYIDTDLSVSNGILKGCIPLAGSGAEPLRTPVPDVLIHAAALVHSAGKDAGEKDWYNVNVALTERLARDAKAAGVKRFVFLSTLAVYGLEAGHITQDTPLLPKTPYGKTKLEAEKRLAALAGDGFEVLILRCPMIYGPGCPGNYQALRKIALKLKIAPERRNARSMLFIGNLGRWVQALIESGSRGVVAPQDASYVCTADMMAEVLKHNGLPARRSRLLGLLVGLAMPLSKVRKAFGSLTVDKALAGSAAAELYGFDDCMRLTEEERAKEPRPAFQK